MNNSNSKFTFFQVYYFHALTFISNYFYIYLLRMYTRHSDNTSRNSICILISSSCIRIQSNHVRFNYCTSRSRVFAAKDFRWNSVNKIIYLSDICVISLLAARQESAHQLFATIIKLYFTEIRCLQTSMPSATRAAVRQSSAGFVSLRERRAI